MWLKKIKIDLKKGKEKHASQTSQKLRFENINNLNLRNLRDEKPIPYF